MLIILLVVSLVLVVVYSREGDEGALHSLQNTTSAVSSPLSSAGTAAGSLAASASASLEDLTADGQTMSQLKESNAQLSQMVVELEEYRQEASRLEALIGIHDVYGFSSVAAHVTGYSSDSYNRIITIDVGTASGVKQDCLSWDLREWLARWFPAQPIHLKYDCSTMPKAALL